MAVCKPRRGSRRNQTLTLAFQPLRLWEINLCCVRHPVYSTFAGSSPSWSLQVQGGSSPLTEEGSLFFPCSIRECYSKSHWLHLSNLPHSSHLNLSTMFLLSTPPLPTLIYTANHQRAFNHKSDITLHWPLISLRIKSKLLHVTWRSHASWSLWSYTTAPSCLLSATLAVFSGQTTKSLCFIQGSVLLSLLPGAFSAPLFTEGSFLSHGVREAFPDYPV